MIEKNITEEKPFRGPDRFKKDDLLYVNDVKGRTATEMSIRQNDFLQTSVAGFNRLQTELLSQIIDKTMGVLKKLGKIPKIAINGKEVKVKYVSPIASLEGDEKMQKMRMFMEFVQGLPEQIQATLISYENIPQDIIEALDLPENYVRSESERKQILQAQQQQQQQQMQIEQMKAQGGNQPM